MVPSRACSSCVTGTNPGAGVTLRATPRASVKMCDSHAAHGDEAGPAAPFSATSTDQSSGRKSHAVFSLAAGIPGPSGLENAYAPPISGAFAKLPGVVAVPPGFPAPRRGTRNLV